MMRKIIYFICFICLNASAQQSWNEVLVKAEQETDFLSAQKLYLQILQMPDISDDTKDSIKYLMARKGIMLGKLDTSLKIVNLSIANAQNRNKTKFLSSFYTLKAACFHHQMLLDSAIFYYIKSIELDIEAQKELKVAYTKVNVGNLFLQQHNWKEAEQFFSEALATIRLLDDSLYLSGVLTSLSTVQFELEKLDASLASVQEALKVAQQRNDIIGLLLAHRQFGHLSRENKASDMALFHYLEADKIAEKIKQPYYIALTSLDLLLLYNEIENPKKAIEYGEKAMAYSGEFTTQTATIYKNLAFAYEQIGAHEKAFQYMSKANEVREKVANESNQRIINDLKEQYSSAQKDKEIAEQNLVIVKEKEKRLIYFFVAIGAVLVIVLLGAILFFKNYLHKLELNRVKARKKRELLESLIQGENNERRRISYELHDGISNQMFNMKLYLTSKEQLNEDSVSQMVQFLDLAQDEMRRIAHNLLPIDFEQKNIVQVLEEYSKKLSLPKEMTLDFQVYKKGLRVISKENQLILFRIMQEFIGNSLKHSQATELNIQIFEDESQLKIQIEDNGLGFDINSSLENGQGVKSSLDRLKTIQAEVNIETRKGNGTFIEILI